MRSPTLPFHCLRMVRGPAGEQVSTEAIMSIFGKIMSSIFGHTNTASAAPAGGASPSAASTAPSTGTAAPSAPAQPVDVAAVLTAIAAKNTEKLDWRRSIVDLMKLLGLDSSLAARKELAQELHYTGNTSDSAAMNVWLHQQVMKKLAENGGKVPEDLMHAAH
jgi:hypothetical protein